jgi:hypothetical protein
MKQCNDRCTSFDRILAANGGVLIRRKSYRRCSWLKTETLAKNSVEVWKFRKMIHRDRTFSNDIVDFLLRVLVCLGVLQQVVEGERKQTGRGLVSSNEEGDHVRNNVLILITLAREPLGMDSLTYGHSLTSLGINTVQHSVEQIFLVGRVLPPRLDHIHAGLPK